MLMLFKPVLPVVEYIVNYEYISKVLCVNKGTPIMGCDGKCYFISQLAKSSESEKPISDKKIVVKDFEVLFFQDIQSLRDKVVSIEPILQINYSYSNLYNYLNSSSHFHPPSFIS